VIATSTDFLILCWFAAAIVGGMIGAAKGRAFAGALWGLLLGPLGWLVIAAAPDQRPKCPECGGDVIRGANRCKNCGHRLKARINVAKASPAETATMHDRNATLPECPGCSSVMVNGVCSLCGFAESPNAANCNEAVLTKVDTVLVPNPV
jgi:predicted amidophosphoribosyltransferase